MAQETAPRSQLSDTIIMESLGNSMELTPITDVLLQLYCENRTARLIGSNKDTAVMRLDHHLAKSQP